VALAETLSKGRKAVVRYRGRDGEAAETGKIMRIAEVADPASDTRAVKVELPNASGRPAGLHVLVEFPSAPRPAKTGAGGGLDKTDASTGQLIGKGK
jgi:hypothetical protein